MFGMHFMVRNVICLYRSECPQPHMQGNKRDIHTLSADTVEQSGREMQPRRGGCGELSSRA